jgi:SOS-response transcriptional repressor LexA
MLYPVVSNDLPGERLRTLRESRGLSLREAAKRSEGGITHAHISHLENDPAAWKKVSHAKVLALARAYNLSLNGLLNEVNGTPYPVKPNIYTDQVHLETPDINGGRRRIPVIDLLSAGPGNDGGTVVSSVDLGEEFVGAHAAYRITGDSMFPDIHDRGTVIIRCQEYSSPKNIIVCWTPEDGMLCKYLDRVEDGYYVLTSVNPAYKPIWTRDIHIYGIVVEIRNPRIVINGNH